MPANSTASISGTGKTWRDADYFAFSPLSGVTIGDTNPGSLDTVTLTLTAGGVASDAHGKLSGTNLTKAGVGVYTLAAATAATLTSELNALVFTPKAGQVPLGQSVTTGITIAVSDQGLTVTDSSTTINVTAENPTPTVRGIDGATGLPGVVSGRGGGSRAVTASSYSLADSAYVNPAQNSLATAFAGNGGAGANAASPQSNAGSGGAGGGATATASLLSTVPSANDAFAFATGGLGGAGGQNSFTGTGGNGGNGGGATATAFARGTFGSHPTQDLYAFAFALSGGGGGGVAYGSGATGGTGGQAYGTKATAASDNRAIAEAQQGGGYGGTGLAGANGGAGAASELVNAVSILSSGAGSSGPGIGFGSYLNQYAIAGPGGDSDTGHGGNGGLAISDLTADYATNPAVAGDLFANIFGTGGDGGGGGIGGNGGPTWDAATVKGAGSVYVLTKATGGNAGTPSVYHGISYPGSDALGGSGGANGQVGGDGQAKATAIGNYVNAEANATGGFGQTTAGIANAAATGTGANGSVVAHTQTGLYSGNLIVGVSGSASAVVDGTNTALSQAGIATTQPSNPGGAIAYIDALPVATYANRAKAGAPHTIAALGATPSIVAVGEVGGAHSTLGTDTQTSSATVSVTMDSLQLTGTPHLFLGFYNVSGSSSGITDIKLNLAFPASGDASFASLDFTSTAAAKASLTDIPIDMGSFGSAAGGFAGFDVTLAVTTNHAGGGVSAYFVVGHG